MKLAFVIATYNRRNTLQILLNQVRNQKGSGIETMSIVVDDASTDGTGEMLGSEFQWVHVVKGTGNWWWTKCMNEGFKKAMELGADHVLILNDDNEIRPDFLKKIEADYPRVPGNSILGSISVSIDPPGLVEMSGTRSFQRFLLRTVPYLLPYSKIQEDITGIFPTYTQSGRGTLIPCDVFRKIGIYEEKLVQYGSDDEFILRARKYGIGTYISWNMRVYNHTYLTSDNCSIKKTTLAKFTAGFFKPQSSNSLRKEIILYRRYGYPILIPVFLLFYIAGSYKSFFYNFRKLKKS